MPLAAVRPDTLYAWSGSSLLVVNTRGACAEDQRLTGYYFRETRFLRTLQLRINGQIPWPCEAASLAPDTLAFTYVHPEIAEPGVGGTRQPGDEQDTRSRHPCHLPGPRGMARRPYGRRQSRSPRPAAAAVVEHGRRFHGRSGGRSVASKRSPSRVQRGDQSKRRARTAHRARAWSGSRSDVPRQASGHLRGS